MFEYIRSNILPYRTKVIFELAQKRLPINEGTITVGEKFTITSTTHPYYPIISEDNIGFDSTSFGDRNPWPNGGLPTNEETDIPYDSNDETVVGGYGYDYIEQPSSTVYRGPSHPEPYGDSISTVEVNGIISDSTVVNILIDTTNF